MEKRVYKEIPENTQIRGLIQKFGPTYSWTSLKHWQTILKVCIHTTHCICNKHTTSTIPSYKYTLTWAYR